MEVHTILYKTRHIYQNIGWKSLKFWWKRGSNSADSVFDSLSCVSMNSISRLRCWPSSFWLTYFFSTHLHITLCQEPNRSTLKHKLEFKPFIKDLWAFKWLLRLCLPKAQILGTAVGEHLISLGACTQKSNKQDYPRLISESSFS